jgi:hypothetical protein
MELTMESSGGLMHSEQEDTLKLQQGGAANERKNNMAEVF